MRSNHIFKRLPRRLFILLVLFALAFTQVGELQTASADHTRPPVGMVCTENRTENAGQGFSTFTLSTETGTITLPDGNTVFMWGFSEGGNPFQHPSPNLCVREGDLVTIVVNNTLPEPVSLIFPGQKSVMANGEPSQAVFNGTTLVSLAPMAQPGGSATYSFYAEEPGTYIYQSGTNSPIQINMGLFGALVVRPADNVYDAQGNLVEAYAYNHPSSRYKADTEYILIMSEIDPMLHQAVQFGNTYDMTNYRARYWLYNGRSFPDTVADNYANWLPNQPYGSLTLIQPLDDVLNPYPALVRYLSVGAEVYPHHPHGNHGRVIARDGHLLRGTADEDLSFEKFLINISPGQTWDVLFHWKDVDHWDPVTNPIPVEIPQLQNLVFGTFYSGSPYLGNLDVLPVGTQALNQCGEYWHIAHNHALQQITAWGVVLSGHITFTRIDPPEGCQPAP